MVCQVKEVVDNYQPDFIWFDGLGQAMKGNHPPESRVLDAIDYFYEESAKRGQEVVVANKHAGKFNFPETFGLLSYENGRDMGNTSQAIGSVTALLATHGVM